MEKINKLSFYNGKYGYNSQGDEFFSEYVPEYKDRLNISQFYWFLWFCPYS